jgi:hypothetical protein
MTALALAPDTRIRYEPAAAAGADRAIRVSTAIAVLAVVGVAAPGLPGLRMRWAAELDDDGRGGAAGAARERAAAHQTFYP